MTVVRYEHHYRRPPRKKPKAAAIEVPAAVRTEPARAKDDRKPAPTSAIVTIRERGSDRVPDMTAGEYQRRGDAAEAMFREMKRKIAAKER